MDHGLSGRRPGTPPNGSWNSTAISLPPTPTINEPTIWSTFTTSGNRTGRWRSLHSSEPRDSIQPSPPLTTCWGTLDDLLEIWKGPKTAFETYIELIPDDPNPYDSYAELLMRTGRFEESITSYRLALEEDDHFVASHIGIATNLNFLDRQDEAHRQLEQMLANARNDGERRGAYFAMAVSRVSAGDLSGAIDCIAVEMALAAKIGDATAMAGDHTNIGLLQLKLGNSDAAEAHFEAALAVVEASDRAEEVKGSSERNPLQLCRRRIRPRRLRDDP